MAKAHSLVRRSTLFPPETMFKRHAEEYVHWNDDVIGKVTGPQ